MNVCRAEANRILVVNEPDLFFLEKYFRVLMALTVN